MDKLGKYRELVQRVLTEYYQLQIDSGNSDLESTLLFDPKNDQYVLMRMGWDGLNRIKRNTIHTRIKNEKVWIEEDETEEGIATELLQLGIPHQDIVLAFHPPQLRQHTEFATA